MFVLTRRRCAQHLVCIRTHTNDHAKDPVVHVGVRWITGNTKKTQHALVVGLGVALALAAAVVALPR